MYELVSSFKLLKFRWYLFDLSCHPRMMCWPLIKIDVGAGIPNQWPEVSKSQNNHRLSPKQRLPTGLTRHTVGHTQMAVRHTGDFNPMHQYYYEKSYHSLLIYKKGHETQCDCQDLGLSPYEGSSYHYRDPNVKNKTVSQPSYIQHGNPIPGNTVFILKRGPVFLTRAFDGL